MHEVCQCSRRTGAPFVLCLRSFAFLLCCRTLYFQQTDVLLYLLHLYSRCFEQRCTRSINIFNLCQHSSDTVTLLSVCVCFFMTRLSCCTPLTRIAARQVKEKASYQSQFTVYVHFFFNLIHEQSSTVFILWCNNDYLKVSVSNSKHFGLVVAAKTHMFNDRDTNIDILIYLLYK